MLTSRTMVYSLHCDGYMKTDHRLHCSPRLHPSTLASLRRPAAGVCRVVNCNLCGAGGCEAGEPCRTRRVGRNMILGWQSRACELNETSSVHQSIWNPVTGFRFLKPVTSFKSGYRLTRNRLTALIKWFTANPRQAGTARHYTTWN